jgi:hypothetical protein
MPRYLVEHQHSAETCPTSNPEMVQGLAQHMKPESAAQNQVELLGECVIPGEHHLIAIVEADSEDNVSSYFAPFEQVGPVSVREVKTCDMVAEQGAD